MWFLQDLQHAFLGNHTDIGRAIPVVARPAAQLGVALVPARRRYTRGPRLAWVCLPPRVFVAVQGARAGVRRAEAVAARELAQARVVALALAPDAHGPVGRRGGVRDPGADPRGDEIYAVVGAYEAAQGVILGRDRQHAQAMDSRRRVGKRFGGAGIRASARRWAEAAAAGQITEDVACFVRTCAAHAVGNREGGLRDGVSGGSGGRGRGGGGGVAAAACRRRSGCEDGIPVAVPRLTVPLGAKGGAGAAGAVVVATISPFAGALPAAMLPATSTIGAILLVAEAGSLIASAVGAILSVGAVSPGSEERWE